MIDAREETTDDQDTTVQINQFGNPVLCERGFPLRVLSVEEVTQMRRVALETGRKVK